MTKQEQVYRTEIEQASLRPLQIYTEKLMQILRKHKIDFISIEPMRVLYNDDALTITKVGLRGNEVVFTGGAEVRAIECLVDYSALYMRTIDANEVKEKKPESGYVL